MYGVVFKTKSGTKISAFGADGLHDYEWVEVLGIRHRIRTRQRNLKKITHFVLREADDWPVVLVWQGSEVTEKDFAATVKEYNKWMAS
jgi:hypothetical protein